MLHAVRYSREQQQENHLRILGSVGRGFRRSGFGGIGVDALAKGARLTSGALYSHLGSKADAFRAALQNGMGELKEGILGFQGRFGDRWIEAFAEFYFTDRVTCELENGCALPSLAGDVARADFKTKTTFEKSYLEVVQALAGGLPGARADAEARAIVLTVLFAGGVTLARAVRSKPLRDRIALTLRDAVIACARG
jgi:TetR/AcrR family transcriptional regulator, transcriptional repressor for nem operon